MIPLEFSTFIGRFHPLLVHLPIGFLVLAILLEWWQGFKKTATNGNLIANAWLLGGISAAAAALCGWYLGETGLHEEKDLFLHRWLGIAIVVIAFVGWYLKKNRTKYPKMLQNGFNVILLVSLFVEGHKGGNMTHGDTYLTEYAPKPIQGLLGTDYRNDSLPTFGNTDSLIVYRDLIVPIFEEKCFACHNNEVQRGGLNMAESEAFLAGGDNGAILLTANSAESELFRRITLPQKNIKFMPPTGNALTYDEIKTVEWWIEQGASFEDSISSMTIGENIRPVLLRRYGIDTTPKPWYETVRLPVLDSEKIRELEKEGFQVKSLGADNPLLDIKYVGNALTESKLQALASVKDHITWLSLARNDIADEWLSTVATFTNLTRLQLEKTPVSDKGVERLKGLRHLESLNLYGTQVTDGCLPIIQTLPGLQRVYLWDTQVTRQGAQGLQENVDGLSVIIGDAL
ncbi:DUF2231 domain-containing protein [Maribacter sp. 2-571]|uniref:DUF2231 domain-containing protein n=1 Tax=Maribacter sp. 2-571 TaxID=3417569 RepID=UPI003D32A91F